jgi:hypothetical protein
MQLDLNDYYPSSNLALYIAPATMSAMSRGPRGGGRDCGCERARAKSGRDPWLKPTLLGTALDAGDVAVQSN